MNNERESQGLDRVAARLDALGARERSRPDDGFEGRIVQGAMRALDESAPAPIEIRARRVWARPIGALAASVTLVGAGALVWLGSRPTHGENAGGAPLATIEQEVDDLLALTELIDEHAGLWTDELRSDADALDESIGRTWETLGVSLTEESI